VRHGIASLFTLILISSPVVAYGQTVTAMWDPSPPSDQVTSYQACIGTTSKSCNVQLASVSNAQTAYIFTPTPGVVHYVAIKATNLVGTSSYSTEASFSIPSFTQPVNQSSPVGVAITPLNMSVTDPDGSARNFTHTGLPTGLALNATTGQITGTPSAAGTYNVTVFVNDSLVTVSRSFVWTITAAAADTTAPALSITSHTNGQTLSAASVTISGTASDSGRGGNGVSSVMVNGQAATGGSATASATASWSRTLTLAQGANTITVQATDSRGNNATQSITLNYAIAPVPNLNPTISITSAANFETTNTTTTITATVADPNGSVASVGWARTYPTTASGPCSVVSGTATCSGVGLVGKANNAFTLTVTDNNGAMATATWNALRRTCDAIPSDDFDVDGGWPASLGPCFTPMTTAALNIGNGNAAASSAATRHLSLRPWTGGAPDDYKVQVTSTSQVTESSFLLFGCFASTTSQGIYNGYVMSMQGLGTSLARYDNGIRTSLTATTQPADGGWSPQEIGTLECEDTGTSTVLTAKDQFGAVIIAATDLTAGRYTSGDPFVGAWGAATFDLFVATELNTPPAQVTSATLTSTVASPQNTNTAVTFTASATGGAAPQQFKFLVQPAGGAAQVMQPWSTATTYAWTPTTAGTYTVIVWARSAGVTVDAAQASAQVAYVVNTPPPAQVTSAALTSTVASPQNTGTAITFIANSSGGEAPHQFKFLVQPAGGAAQVMQPWSTATTYAWTPTTAGTYTVIVWARSARVTVDAAQASAQMTYIVNTPPPAPVASVALTSNLATPQNTGTAITFFTAGAGGEAPHQFKFLVQPAGGAAQMVQNWSTATTYTWKPETAGTYTVIVWARSAGVTVDAAQASAQIAYAVNPAPIAPVTSATLTPNMASPQGTGTSITFAAAASGGVGPQQYKFLLQSTGGAAQIVQNWGTATTYTWTPAATGDYIVTVWARSAGATVDAAQASAQVTYPVIASGVNAVSVLPSSGSGSAQTFTLAYSDSRGASNLISEWVWFVGGTGVCMAYHERATNLVYLLNDAGTAWTSKMLGSASILQGSSCAINLGSSSASASGSGLTLNLAIAFTPAFSGEKTVRIFANAAGGVSTGWQDRGSWTVTSSAPAPSPTTTRGRKKPRAITETSTAAPEPTPTPTLTSGPLTITGVTSNLASPQIAGTSITFFAGATGGSGPYQFKWFIFDGVSWTVARDWSSATTFEWRPTTRGTYGIGIWVRDATTTADVGTVSWSASYRINKARIGG